MLYLYVMKIFIGTDHAGFELKNKLYEYLINKGHDVVDVGPFEYEKLDDYPDFAFEVATKVIGEDDSKGILICTSGQGMAMAANRVRGIRAAVVWDEEAAKHSREHNDANVISLPGKRVSEEEAKKIIDTWLETEFTNEERHKRRIAKIEEFS